MKKVGGSAVSSFFAKKGVKAKSQPAAGGGGDLVSTSSMFSDFAIPGEYFGSSSQGWDEAVLDGESPGLALLRPDVSGLESALRSQLNVAVGELADDEGEDEEMMRRRIESEEARKKLSDAAENTAKAAQKLAAQKLVGASPPSVSPAAPSASTYVAPSKRVPSGGNDSAGEPASGVKDARILSEDTKAFPSLFGSSAPSIPVPVIKAGNPWAKIVIEESSASVAKIESSGSVATNPSSIDANALIYTGNQPSLVSEEEVLEKTRFIIEELLDAGDYAYALQRFTEIRCVEDLRRHVVVGILEAGLYLATDLSKQMRVGRILSLVVPAKIVSRSQLVTGVSGFMANLKTHLLDYPKADTQLGVICSNGTVFGTLKEAAFPSSGVGIPRHDSQAQKEFGYVPVGHIAPEVAKHFPPGGVKDIKSAGSLLAAVHKQVENVDVGSKGAENGVGGAAKEKDGGEEDEVSKVLPKKKKKQVVADEDD